MKWLVRITGEYGAPHATPYRSLQIVEGHAPSTALSNALASLPGYVRITELRLEPVGA